MYTKVLNTTDQLRPVVEAGLLAGVGTCATKLGIGEIGTAGLSTGAAILSLKW